MLGLWADRLECDESAVVQEGRDVLRLTFFFLARDGVETTLRL
jgi:hypothetical protein